MYGKSLQRNLNQSFTGSQIIENPELLQAMEEINDKCNKEITTTKEIPKPVTPEIQEFQKPSTPLIPANKQIETRLPSGKRRITPMFLTPAPVTSKYEYDKFCYCNCVMVFCLLKRFFRSSIRK